MRNKTRVIIISLFFLSMQLIAVADGSITGKLIAPNGKAIPNAKVTAIGDSDKHYEATTDKNGKFKLSPLSDGLYMVAVIDAGIYVAKPILNVKVVSGKPTILPSIKAIRGVVVSGNVLDAATKKPVVGARVSVVDSNYYLNKNYYDKLIPLVGVSVDSNGKYKTIVAPDNVSIIYQGGNKFYLPAEQIVNSYIIPKSGLSNANMYLMMADIARGKIVDKSGNAVANAVITIIGSSTSKGESGQDGLYELALPQAEASGCKVGLKCCSSVGTVVVNVATKDNSFGTYQVVDRQRLLNVDYKLEVDRARPFTVIVRDKIGNPIDNANIGVTYFIGDRGYTYSAGLTGRDGAIDIPGIYDGIKYRILAQKKGYYQVDYDNSSKIIPGKGEWIDKQYHYIVMDEATRVQKGVVVDESGIAVVGARVEAAFGPVAKTAVDGSFTLENMPDSEVDIWAYSGLRLGKATVSDKTPYVVIKILK